MRAFQLSVDNAILFFELCAELKANTEAERHDLLVAMSKLGYVDRVFSTQRSKDEYIKNLSKHFKVLKVVDKGAFHDSPTTH